MSGKFRTKDNRGVSSIVLKKAASAQRAADVILEVFDEKGKRYNLAFPANVIPAKNRKQVREGIETATFKTIDERDLCKPLFEGQLGVQLDTGALYRSNSVERGDWVLVSAGGGVASQLPFNEFDVSSSPRPSANDPFTITTGSFDTAGAQTPVSSDGTVILPVSGALFISDSRIKIYRNGVLQSKGADSAANRDIYWVSTTKLAFEVKLRVKDSIVVVTPESF